jgi:transcriptional regulator with XRE-family HTH domain
MVRQFGSPRHEELRRLLVEKRLQAKLSQTELARRLRWSQGTVSKVETGEKRVTVVELIELAEVLGFDVSAAVKRIARRR